jgi:hypothetical protein
MFGWALKMKGAPGLLMLAIAVSFLWSAPRAWAQDEPDAWAQEEQPLPEEAEPKKKAPPREPIFQSS